MTTKAVEEDKSYPRARWKKLRSVLQCVTRPKLQNFRVKDALKQEENKIEKMV